MQVAIITLSIVVIGFPAIVIAIFAFFLLRNPKNYRPTENILGFLLLFCFLTILPFVAFIAEILKYGKGFFGYYLLIPPALNRLYCSDKTTLFFFVVYLISIHVLGFMPFFVALKIALLKRNMAGVKLTESNSKLVMEIKGLIDEIRPMRGIGYDIEVRMSDDKSPGCAIMKQGNNAVFAINKSFLELLSNNIITKEELKAILHHEISHLINKDYFIPVLGKAILNRQFAMIVCFSFSLYLVTMVKYPFFGDVLAYNSRMSSWPVIFTIIPPFISFCMLIGFLIWGVSMFLRRCEILADNLALQYIPKKILFDIIVKMGVLSGTTQNLAMPFSSNNALIKTNRTLMEDILHAISTMNIFSSYNKIYFHPNTEERLKFLNNPQEIVEEEGIGLLRFEVFGIMGILAAFIPQLAIAITESLIKNVNWQDIGLSSISYMVYFLLVFLACIPLLYSKNQFTYNLKSIKLIALYSALISIFANLGVSIKNASLIFQDFTGKNEFIVRMFIKSQISRIINLFINGFFFAFILLVIFISIGNFVIKIKKPKKEVNI